MLRLIAIPATALLVLAAVISWSLGENGTRADFTFINRGNHTTLDPGTMAWLQDIRIAYALWEGLYTLDPRTLRPIPGAADRIEVDPKNTVYTFHLRDNARWSNGDPVSSGDFVFAWRRMLEQPADYTSLHFYIRGARKYSKDYTQWLADMDTGKLPRDTPPPDYDQVGVVNWRMENRSGRNVKVIDDHFLQVTLENPTPFFPALCAFPPFFPLHEPSMREFGQKDEISGRVTSYAAGFTRPPHLVSNGPYRLAAWEFQRKLRLVASDYYWNKAAVKSRVIDEMIVPDPTAAFRSYLNGKVDWLADVDGNLIGDMLQKGGRADLHVFPGFGTYYFTFNCKPKLPDGRSNPLVDARVRQALAMSIDKRPIVENVARAGQKIAACFIPPGIFPGYPSPAGLPYDIAEAKRRLASAGYPDGRGFPPLTILFSKEGQHGDISLILRNQWQANLGIHINLEQVEVSVFSDRLKGREFEIARSSWIGDYADPTTFTDKFKSDNQDNNAAWENKEYDAACAQASAEPDQARRLQLLAQAENILLEDAPIIPLYHYVNAYMFRAGVTGIPLDPRNMVMLQAVEAR